MNLRPCWFVPTKSKTASVSCLFFVELFLCSGSYLNYCFTFIAPILYNNVFFNLFLKYLGLVQRILQSVMVPMILVLVMLLLSALSLFPLRLTVLILLGLGKWYNYLYNVYHCFCLVLIFRNNFTFNRSISVFIKGVLSFIANYNIILWPEKVYRTFKCLYQGCFVFPCKF